MIMVMTMACEYRDYEALAFLEMSQVNTWMISFLSLSKTETKNLMRHKTTFNISPIITSIGGR